MMGDGLGKKTPLLIVKKYLACFTLRQEAQKRKMKYITICKKDNTL